VLVVGRVDVDEVDVEVGGELVGVETRDRPRPALDRLGKPKRELVVGPRRPRLEIGHLESCRAVDAVGGLEQRGEEHPAFHRRERVAVYRLPDRLDPGSVRGLEVPCPATERLGEPTLAALERGNLGQDLCQTGTVERPAGRNVGLAEHLGVGSEIVRVDGEPPAS